MIEEINLQSNEDYPLQVFASIKLNNPEKSDVIIKITNYIASKASSQ